MGSSYGFSISSDSLDLEGSVGSDGVIYGGVYFNGNVLRMSQHGRSCVIPTLCHLRFTFVLHLDSFS